MAEPVLKWAGGKRQLLGKIYARFPVDYGRYHEPFFGGGAVFFDLEPADRTVNDTNPVSSTSTGASATDPTS